MGDTRCNSPLSSISSNLLSLLRLPASNTKFLNSPIDRGPLLRSHIDLPSAELIRTTSAELHILVSCLSDLVGTLSSVTGTESCLLVFYSSRGYSCFLHCLLLALLNMGYTLFGCEPGPSVTTRQITLFGKLDVPCLGCLANRMPCKGIGLSFATKLIAILSFNLLPVELCDPHRLSSFRDQANSHGRSS